MVEEKKKVLLVDDSALMRRVLCDIIESDERFCVQDRAINGLDAFDLLTRKTYDAVVLDVNMPKMTGVELLRELNKRKIPAKIMMASTDTSQGAKITLECLELGAIDFVHKPELPARAREDDFREHFLNTLVAVTMSRPPVYDGKPILEDKVVSRKVLDMVRLHNDAISDNQIVAIASSTGGPKALHSVIPQLPKNLKAPVLIVQHMPFGFTKTLAERLDSLSELRVKEAEEGEVLEAGTVYVARGGSHMNIVAKHGQHRIHYSDEPPREGVKPCANYMYESLAECGYSKVVCVVLTGMGADGTKGIVHLKEKKQTHVIAQDEASCAVFGMPKSVIKAEQADQVVELQSVAQEIIMNVGVR